MLVQLIRQYFQWTFIDQQSTSADSLKKEWEVLSQSSEFRQIALTLPLFKFATLGMSVPQIDVALDRIEKMHPQCLTKEASPLDLPVSTRERLAYPEDQLKPVRKFDSRDENGSTVTHGGCIVYPFVAGKTLSATPDPLNPDRLFPFDTDMLSLFHLEIDDGKSVKTFCPLAFPKGATFPASIDPLLSANKMYRNYASFLVFPMAKELCPLRFGGDGCPPYPCHFYTSIVGNEVFAEYREPYEEVKPKIPPKRLTMPLVHVPAPQPKRQISAE